jgi:mannose-1-phosphate guanylyltransferase
MPSLAAILGEGDLEVLGDEALVTAIDATGLVATSDRQICLLGLKDVVVVDTGDALLVASRDQAQRVKDLVAELKASGRDELT